MKWGYPKWNNIKSNHYAFWINFQLVSNVYAQKQYIISRFPKKYNRKQYLQINLVLLATCVEPRSEYSVVPLDSHQHRAHLNLTGGLIHGAGRWRPCAPSSSRPRRPVINLPLSVLPVTFFAQVDASRARTHLPSYSQLMIYLWLAEFPFDVSISKRHIVRCVFDLKEMLLDVNPFRRNECDKWRNSWSKGGGGAPSRMTGGGGSAQ